MKELFRTTLVTEFFDTFSRIMAASAFLAFMDENLTNK